MLTTFITALLSACAVGGKQPLEETGNLISAKAVNKKIAAQGLSRLCPKNECDQLPKLIKGEAPHYPETLSASGGSGRTTIIFTINEQGSTTDLKVKSATGNDISNTALAALRTWKFSPALLQGKPVSVTTQLTFAFDSQE